MPHTSQVGLQAEGAKKGACQHCIQRGKGCFQKKATEILVDKQQQQQQREGEEKEGFFTVVSLDESFFFYDSLVRRVWIGKEKRPVVKVTGSHKYPNMHFRSLKSGGKAAIQAVLEIQRRYVS